MDQRAEDLDTVQRLARQNAELAARLDKANAEDQAARAREQAVMRKANEATKQVKAATKDTIEALQASLQDAFQHNRVLEAQLALHHRNQS
jgi:translation initiation factor IF-2